MPAAPDDLRRLDDKELRRRIWNLQAGVAILDRVVRSLPHAPADREALRELQVRLEFSREQLKKLTAEKARREGDR